MLSKTFDEAWVERWALRRGGLGPTDLLELAARPALDPAVYHPTHPPDGFALSWDNVTAADVAAGYEAIRLGRVARVVMAGGTCSSVFYEQLPGVGCSLLAWHALLGTGRTWWMVNPGDLHRLASHLSSVVLPPGSDNRAFEQFEAPALLPDMSDVARDPYGDVVMLPCGHGDVGPALVESGLLDESTTVDHVVVCNADNPLASPDPGLIGLHARSGVDVTCELVERDSTDRGGVPAELGGRLQLAEDWRLPAGFAADSTWFNTNTTVVSARALRAHVPWRWHRIARAGAVQHVRLLQQLTEEFGVQYVTLPRRERYASARTMGLRALGDMLDAFRVRL